MADKNKTNIDKAKNNNELIQPIIFEENKPIPEKDLVKPITFGVRTKSFEEKIYIILYRLNECEDEAMSKIFEICVGRTETYNDIKNKFLSGMSIDVHRSKIITETKQTETSTGDEKYYMTDYEDCISLYSFCKKVEEYYNDQEFDIEDFNDTDVPETNELESHPMYLTKEQQEYRDMLMSSIKRNKFITELREEYRNNGLIDGNNV